MSLAASSALPRLAASSVTDDRLLERLARRLESEGVPYCQWKGHGHPHRWASGQGDIDLLVDRRAISAFRALAGELGFKPARLPGERQLPGVESYFGHDPRVARLLHLHVHYRLTIGDFWRTTYRLPLERQILEASVQGPLFKVPRPEHQFVIFVLRAVLRQRGRLPDRRWFKSVRIGLDDLHDRCSPGEIGRILQHHLPSVDPAFFERCVSWLRRECGPGDYLTLPWQLHRRLRTHARPPKVGALWTAGLEKALPARISRWIPDGRMRPCGGGTVVALIGGDGSGKTTCVQKLERWLCADFATMRAQFGNPPRSLLTFVVGGALKVESVIKRVTGRKATGTSELELVRYLCTARDRYRLYQKVQRFSAEGGIAVCERYPVSTISSHVGPSIPALLPAAPSAFARFLQSAEARYYRLMLPPDVLVVLRLDPELAVARKPDEPADYVRSRGRTVWETDWTATGAEVVDASRQLDEVLEDLKGRIWLAL